MSALDDACRELLELAKKEGGVLLVDVRDDGRVTISRECHDGRVRWVVRADLVPDSAHPLPSVALAVRKGEP